MENRTRTPKSKKITKNRGQNQNPTRCAGLDFFLQTCKFKFALWILNALPNLFPILSTNLQSWMKSTRWDGNAIAGILCVNDLGAPCYAGGVQRGRIGTIGSLVQIRVWVSNLPLLYPIDKSFLKNNSKPNIYPSAHCRWVLGSELINTFRKNYCKNQTPVQVSFDLYMQHWNQVCR